MWSEGYGKGKSVKNTTRLAYIAEQVYLVDG